MNRYLVTLEVFAESESAVRQAWVDGELGDCPIHEVRGPVWEVAVLLPKRHGGMTLVQQFEAESQAVADAVVVDRWKRAGISVTVVPSPAQADAEAESGVPAGYTPEQFAADVESVSGVSDLQRGPAPFSDPSDPDSFAAAYASANAPTIVAVATDGVRIKGRLRISQRRGEFTGTPVYTLEYMGPEGSPGFGVWESVISSHVRAELEAFAADPPDWFGSNGIRPEVGGAR